MTRNIGRRLERLERRFCREEEDCTGEVTLIIDAGNTVPEDAARCPLCGEVHTLEVEEQIVEVQQ